MPNMREVIGTLLQISGALSMVVGVLYLVTIQSSIIKMIHAPELSIWTIFLLIFGGFIICLIGEDIIIKEKRQNYLDKN
jgi:predicted lysophospholipase L1 biosynthesis ABC-type transport system permease subunit